VLTECVCIYGLIVINCLEYFFIFFVDENEICGGGDGDKRMRDIQCGDGVGVYVEPGGVV